MGQGVRNLHKDDGSQDDDPQYGIRRQVYIVRFRSQIRRMTSPRTGQPGWQDQISTKDKVEQCHFLGAELLYKRLCLSFYHHLLLLHGYLHRGIISRRKKSYFFGVFCRANILYKKLKGKYTLQRLKMTLIVRMTKMTIEKIRMTKMIIEMMMMIDMMMDILLQFYRSFHFFLCYF